MSGALAETNKKNMVDLVRPPLCPPLLLHPFSLQLQPSRPHSPVLAPGLVGGSHRP